jgi:hypothetical protein
LPAKNDDMETIQAEAIKRFNQLQSILDDTTDYDLAQSVVMEMQEVNHRITLAGSLLFAAQSQALAAKADLVSSASRKAQRDLRDFANAKDVMDAITGFLGVVDQAIDLAKTL